MASNPPSSGSISCPKCHAGNDSTAKFCGKCGAAMASEPVLAAPKTRTTTKVLVGVLAALIGIPVILVVGSKVLGTGPAAPSTESAPAQPQQAAQPAAAVAPTQAAALQSVWRLRESEDPVNRIRRSSVITDAQAGSDHKANLYIQCLQLPEGTGRRTYVLPFIDLAEKSWIKAKGGIVDPFLEGRFDDGPISELALRGATDNVFYDGKKAVDHIQLDFESLWTPLVNSQRLAIHVPLEEGREDTYIFSTAGLREASGQLPKPCQEEFEHVKSPAVTPSAAPPTEPHSETPPVAEPTKPTQTH